VQADTSDEVLKNWEIIKNEEKQRVSLGDKLRAIPPMLPALMRAAKVQKKTEYADTVTRDELIDVLQRKLDALRMDTAPSQQAFGDILMDVTALCRRAEIDPEEALSNATNALIEKVANGENIG
jgi:uncharacterized protein YabN with tetrapyrrole methylase and pyrophosphatase domain